MATPKFFQRLPNVKYSMSVDSAGYTDDVTIKDFYRLMRLTDEAFRESTLYNEYIIKEGERPDQIAYEVYGDSQYYWAILLINNIIDYAAEWPLSNEHLETFMVQKYGSLEAAQKTHHWETEEVVDDSGSVILEAGLEVNEEFVFYYYPDPTANAQLSSRPTAVTCATYERRLNDAKEKIVLLREEYIFDFAREYQNWAELLPDSRSSVGIYDAIR